MAVDVESPIGSLSWAALGWIAVAALALLVLVVGVLRRNAGRRVPTYLGLAIALACGAWTFATIGNDVTVPIPEDSDGAVCISTGWNAAQDRRFDEASDRSRDTNIDWDTDCGQALKKHLWASVGPTGLAVVAVGGLGVWTAARPASRRQELRRPPTEDASHH